MYFSSVCIDFVDIPRRSSARGYNYITLRRAGLSATAGLSWCALHFVLDI